MENQNLLLAVEAGHASTVEGRAARVDDERHHLARTTEILQRHYGIFASTDRNNHGISVLSLQIGQRRRGLRSYREYKIHELQVVGLDAVLVHELAESVPVELTPPPLLVLGE